MRAGLAEIMRRERARLRTFLLTLFSLVVLAVLGAGLSLPRSWVSEAVLSFDTADAAVMRSAEQSLRRLAAGRDAGELVIESRGRELQLRVSSADPAPLRSGLSALIGAFSNETQAAIVRSLDAEGEALARALASARTAHETAQQALADALAALPEGGNTAAAARLGKLQAEADGLALEIREGRTRIEALEVRVQELDAAIAAARPDTAPVEALERQLERAQGELGRAATVPGADMAKARADLDAVSASLEQARKRLAGQRSVQTGLEARRETTQEELDNQGSLSDANAGRARKLQRLVADARSELLRLEGENAEIGSLNKAESAAERAMRDAEYAVARHAAAIERQRQRPDLPFTLSAPPAEPRLGEGLASWKIVLIALGAGAVAVFLWLFGVALAGRSTKSVLRLAEQLQVRALVELPVWEDRMGDPAVRRRHAAAVLLALLSVAACAVFLRLA